MTNILSEVLALAQLYKTRDRLADNAAYEKAEAVLEIRDELREAPGFETAGAAELLKQAELEHDCCEEAMAEPVGRYVPVRHVECRPLLGGFELIQGNQRIQIPAHAVDRILDAIGHSRALDRQAKKAARIHRRRQADGRPWGAVVGGRLAKNEQAA